MSSIQYNPSQIFFQAILTKQGKTGNLKQVKFVHHNQIQTKEVMVPKNALIIGGTKGLGVAIASQMRDASIRTFVTGRSADKTLPYQLRFDVTDKAAIDQLFSDFSQGKLNIDFLVYCPGKQLKGSAWKMDEALLLEQLQLSVISLLWIVRGLKATQSKPFHLIVISSTTSFRIRDDEAFYGAGKAAQAQLTRNLHRELLADNDQHQTLLVHPCGMKTDFWQDTSQETEFFIPPNKVATIILTHMFTQEAVKQTDFKEIHLSRNLGGSPNPLVTVGAPAPH